MQPLFRACIDLFPGMRILFPAVPRLFPVTEKLFQSQRAPPSGKESVLQSELSRLRPGTLDLYGMAGWRNSRAVYDGSVGGN